MKFVRPIELASAQNNVQIPNKLQFLSLFLFNVRFVPAGHPLHEDLRLFICHIYTSYICPETCFSIVQQLFMDLAFPSGAQ